MRYLLIFIISCSTFSATFNERWNALKDSNHAFYSLYPNIANKKQWFREFQKLPKEKKEQIMKALEMKDGELEIVREKWKQRDIKYKQAKKRIAELDISFISDPVLKDIITVLKRRR